MELNNVSAFQIVSFYGYLILCWRQFGPLPSISDSFYRWQTLDQSRYFVIFTLLIGVPMFLQTHFYSYKPISGLLLNIAGGLLYGVSIAANFREKRTGLIHYICTMVAIALGFAALIVENWLVGVIAICIFALSLVIMKALNVKCFTTKAEISAFNCIFLPLLFFTKHPEVL